jgi:hypothetical protein
MRRWLPPTPGRGWMMSNSDAIERLLERLQTGWAPKTDEIDREILKGDLTDWDFWKRTGHLIGWQITWDVEPPGLDNKETGDVLWIDEHLEWALCADGFWWLYTREEGEKMRYLGG